MIVIGAAGIVLLITNVVLAGFHADSSILRLAGFALFFTATGIAAYWRYRPPPE